MQLHFPHDHEPGMAYDAPRGFAPADYETGSWFLDALSGRPGTVGEIAPAGYPAYALLPHPYWREVPPATAGSFYDPADSEHESGYWSKPVRRSEVARLLETTGAEPPLDPPIDSAMGAPPLIPPLVGVLRRHTPAGAACLCGFWQVELPSFGNVLVHQTRPGPRSRGFSQLTNHIKSLFRTWRARNRASWLQRRIVEAAMAHGSPGEILLYRGALDEIAWWLSHFGTIKTYFHPPTVFWPEDRRWCVVMPQNKPISIVAGTHALIEDVVALAEIDVVETTASDSVSYL